MTQDFFTRENTQSLLGVAIFKLSAAFANTTNEKLRQLNQALLIIKSNAEKFDQNTQTNIDWIGSSLINSLVKYGEPAADPKSVDEIYSSIFRFIVEFDLSIQNDISLELKRFRAFTLENLSLFNKEAQEQMRFALLEMPISIMKSLLGSDVLRNVRSMELYTADITKRLKTWDAEILEKQNAATELKKSLDNYATAFNFVGLYEGFDQLSNTKKEELAGHRKWLLLFGILSILPVATEFMLLSWNLDRISEMRWAVLIGAIPAIPLTVLFVYFFRIVLRSFDATKSQLLQLELRKTLCRFIQKYAEYSKTLKQSNGDSLAKFENVIFSGLVSSDEKLPATFDGIEQLANMVKAFQAK